MGDELICNSGNPDDPISEVKVYDGEELVLTNNECGGQTCETNISSLSSGTYFVRAYTTNGSFSDNITI